MEVQKQLYEADQSKLHYEDAAEFLLGCPLPPEPENIADAVYYAPGAEAMGTQRQLVYTGLLRTMAQARAEDRRQLPPASRGIAPARWNELWATTKRLNLLANDVFVDVEPSVRQATMAANVQRFMHEGLDDGTPQLRPVQMPYMESIATFLLAGPSRITVDREQGATEHFIHGVTVDGPTGIGKTVLIARTIAALGVGRKIEHRVEHISPLRALIVEPSQQLVRQLTGKEGDDTLRRFIGPDVTIGAAYHLEKDIQADVVVATIPYVVKHLQDGLLAETEKFDIMFIDEAHHLLSPTFRDAVLNHWRGPVIGMTATTGYNKRSDVRSILPAVINHGNTIDFIKSGDLNGAQLLLFSVNPRDKENELGAEVDLDDPVVRHEVGGLMAESAAVDFIAEMVKSGRRGIVYSEYGDRSESARRIAHLLQTWKDEDGRPICDPSGKPLKAVAIGSFRNTMTASQKNGAIIEAYRAGELHVLTSVEYGREGMNADIDFVVITAPVSSLLKIKQIVGRGTRPSNRFPTTIYAQFARVVEYPEVPAKTIYEAFGLETVEQNYTIRSSGRSLRRREYYAFPPHLLAMLQDVSGKKTGEALISAVGDKEIPEDYIRFDDLAGPDGFKSSGYARVLLAQAGYQWIGRREQVDGVLQQVRYYEPAAANFFSERATFQETYTAFNTACETLHVTRHLLKTIIGEHDISLHERERGRYISQTDMQTVSRIIAEIPVLADGDIWASDLAKECGQATPSKWLQKLGVAQQYRRRVTKAGTQLVQIVTHEDAERIRRQNEHVQIMASDDMIMADIARAAGVNQEVVSRRLTGDEMALAHEKRRIKRGRRGLMLAWTKEDGLRIAERIRRRTVSLPSHLITMQGAAQMVAITDSGIRAILKRNKIQPAKLPLPGAPKTVCIDWNMMQALEQQFGHRDGAAAIDYRRLPRSVMDTDPGRKAYAQAVQYLLLPAERLGFNPQELQAAAEQSKRIRRRRTRKTQ